MKLYNFFLLIMSLMCTLSEALPARGNQCAPVNSDDAALRNQNGATLSLFSNQVRVTVTQAYIEPSTTRPFGGILVDVVNDYCITIRIHFRVPGGATYGFYVGGRSVQRGIHIPRAVANGAVIQVTIHDAV